MKPHRPSRRRALALSLTPLAADRCTGVGRERHREDPARRPAPRERRGAARRCPQRVRVLPGGRDRLRPGSVSAAPPRCRSRRLDGVKLFREELISVARLGADGGTGRWPDALVPDVDDVVGEKRNAFPFDVTAGESRAIWVEVHVPADARAGAVTRQRDGETGQGRAEHPGHAGGAGTSISPRPPRSARASACRTAGGAPRTGSRRGDAQPARAVRAARARSSHLADRTQRRRVRAPTGDFDRLYGPLVDGTAPTRLAGARLTLVKYVGDRTRWTSTPSWAKHVRGTGLVRSALRLHLRRAAAHLRLERHPRPAPAPPTRPTRSSARSSPRSSRTREDHGVATRTSTSWCRW